MLLLPTLSLLPSLSLLPTLLLLLSLSLLVPVLSLLLSSSLGARVLLLKGCPSLSFCLQCVPMACMGGGIELSVLIYSCPISPSMTVGRISSTFWTVAFGSTNLLRISFPLTRSLPSALLTAASHVFSVPLCKCLLALCCHARSDATSKNHVSSTSSLICRQGS